MTPEEIRREAVEILETLRERFSNAHDKFPGISHFIAQRAKDGMYPIIPEALFPKPLERFRIWDETVLREGETGYPTKHWIKPSFIQHENPQVIMEAIERFDILALEAGKVVGLNDNILPASKTELWVKSPVEYWILLLHRFKPRPRQRYFYPDKGKTFLTGKEPECRDAKEGESYFSWIEDIFLSSALVCGFLIGKIQAELDSARQDDIKVKLHRKKLSAKAKALAVWTEHPSWTDTQIAEAAGINRTTLYDYPEFKNLRAAQKQDKNRIRRGSKDREGNVEVVDE